MSSLARGATSVAAAALFVKAFSALSQVVLGSLLRPEAFGAFALVTGLALVPRAFQDRGIRESVLLWDGGSSEADDVAAAYTAAKWTNIAAGLLLLLLAPLMARISTAPDLAVMLGMAGVAIWIGAPAAMHSALHQREMSLGRVAVGEAAGGAAHYSSALAGAASGLGASSLTVGFIAAPVARVITLRTARLRDQLAKIKAARGVPVRAHFGRIAKLSGGTLGFSFAGQGDNLVLAAFLSPQALGYYFFGYQLVAQLAGLFTVVSQQTLHPWFAQNRDARGTESAVRIAASTVVAVSIAAGFVVILLPEVEKLVWGGRWQPAVFVMQAFAISLPIRAGLEVLKARALGAGDFGRWSLLGAATGMGTGVVALGAGLASKSHWNPTEDLALVASVVSVGTGLLFYVGGLILARGRRADVIRWTAAVVVAVAFPGIPFVVRALGGWSVAPSLLLYLAMVPAGVALLLALDGRLRRS